MSTLLTTPDIPEWVTTLTDAIERIVNPILFLIATAGIIYAIVVGVKFVKADEKGERDEAKAKLISVIIGIVVTGLLIGLFYWLADAIKDGDITFNWIEEDNKTTTTDKTDKNESSSAFINPKMIVDTIKVLLA